ncbi:TolC family protein [Enterobacillus tribolii]|nr:TolC family protein [Enterobacillus tribolii]
MQTQTQYMNSPRTAPAENRAADASASGSQRAATTVNEDYARVSAPDTSSSVSASGAARLDRDALRLQSASSPASPQETTGNKAALKKNYDFFPPVTEYYKPDPTYDKVRWQGESPEGGERRSVKGDMSRQAFGARSSSPSRAFLRSMVARALAYSPEMRVATAEVLAAEYNIDQAKGQRWPQVKLGVSSPFTSVGGDSSTSRNNKHINDTSGSVSVSTPIFDWGRISNQVDNAEETAKASRYSKDYSREQMAYTTISELMNLSRYQQSRVVAKAYVDRMKELVDMLSQITQADPGRASELVQARAKLMSAQASLDNIEHQLSTSRIKLVRLLGVEPKLPEDITWRDTVIPASTAISSLDKNPMMLNLQARVRAAEHEANSIKSSSLPQVNWVISKSTAKDSNGDESGWYTGLNVEWNAFSGGSQSAAQMSARAKANAAQQQYEVSYRDLEYQINNQVQIRDSSFLRADDYDRLSSETDRVRQMFYDQWYHLGKRTLLDVLTAENDHFNNQLSAINNRYDGYISNINVISSAAMLLSWVGIAPE